MIYKAEHHCSVEEYAKRCRVSVRNIRDRIRRGTVRYVKLEKFYFVNVAASPPVKRINPHRPVSGGFTLAESFSFHGLREVGYFARGKHFSEGIIYEAIILGKLDAYIIADKVFINPAEGEQVYKKGFVNSNPGLRAA